MSAQIARDLSPTSQAVQRIVIADKRAHYRETLERVLKRSAFTLAEAATLSQAARLATSLKPDVVLLDVDLVLNVSSERLRRLAAKFPDLRIIIMLNEDLPQYRAAVRERWGYLCMAKERPEEELRTLGILTRD